MATFKMWGILLMISLGAPYALGDISRWFLRFTNSHEINADRGVCVGKDASRLRTYSNELQNQYTENYMKLSTLTDHETILDHFLFGAKVAEARQKDKEYDKIPLSMVGDLFSKGNFMRAELFRNASAVHQPLVSFMVPGHGGLRITRDHMQTAVNAFAIFVHGNLFDILNLPPKYVLQSARTISMMKIAHDKLAATWAVVREGRDLIDIPPTTLEAFRPLFKYVNAREMAQLNLSDARILKYVGTHPDLSRHQVGVIASRYIQLNRDWTNLKYLNQMNNLLCGVPMLHMRKLPPNTYLQLSHQIFYHIRACDPLQRRFYLKMMTKTQALGKPFSWSARDVSRLGLLLSEISENEVASIKPKAMAGLTPQVVMEMPVKILGSITEAQSQYIDPKALNIMAKKVKAHQDLLGTRTLQP